jgi:uncharacterized protein (TIGR03437 family)
MRPLIRLTNRMTIAALAVVLLITFILLSHLADGAGVPNNIIGRAAAQNTGVVAVNGTTFTAPVARGSFTVLLGTNLATGTAEAFGPYPTQLAGTTVSITDANNVQYMLQLIYVSPGQINCKMPDQVVPGTINITVTSGNGTVSTGTAQVVNSAPGLFTYGSQGVALGATTYEGGSIFPFFPIYNPDGSPVPIDPGTPWKRNILVLFGTGIRYAQNIRVRIGNVDFPVVYAGQDAFQRPGFDQLNILINGTNLPVGPTTLSVIADNQVSNITQATFSGGTTNSPNLLSLNDVQMIIAQCVQAARQRAQAGVCAVVDREGNALAVFQMNGAPQLTTITADKPPGGLQGIQVPTMLAAVSKAGTSAFFSTLGSAISTRTASFIIGEHFPRGIPGTESGPLNGVQFSQLPCSDVRLASLPLGLSGDPGSASPYRGIVALGGVAFESDSRYDLDAVITDQDQDVEEAVAFAAIAGFDTPQALRIDNVRVNGILLPYVNATQRGGPAPPVTAADGMYLLGPRGAPPSRYILVNIGGVQAKVDPRFAQVIAPNVVQFRDSPLQVPNKLLAADVFRIIAQGLQTADRTRAAIRVGGAVPAEVNVSVVDTAGNILGIASTDDAPEFGFDVCVQKGRTANLFSNPNAANLLLGADGGTNLIAPFVNAALGFGVPLNGSIMFSSRGMGFLARPFFPDGIDAAPNGPFSTPINVYSAFNNGLQLSLVTADLVAALGGDPSFPCTAIPITANGIQIFPGSAVLFKNGMQVGAIGISGDGVDQDDFIAGGGSVGFEAPSNINSSNLIIRGVRIPYLRYPAFPQL